MQIKLLAVPLILHHCRKPFLPFQSQHLPHSGASIWRHYCQQLQILFEMVATLGNAHVSFTLLKFCLGVCEINYLLRVTPVQCTKLGAQLFDKFLENGLRTIVGGCLTTNYSWNFNCLPKAAQTVRTRPLAWDLLPPSLPPRPHS